MSNVLIGIIGVILFIGLALAGALFLGPRFQESVNNSKASSAVQAVSQVAHAANMYGVDTGTPMSAGTNIVTTLVPEYLKSMPSNPVGGLNISPSSLTGTSGGAAGFIVMPIGSRKSICDAIARQTGIAVADAAPTIATWTQSTVPGVSGCVQSTQDAIGGSGTGDYIVYARI